LVASVARGSALDVGFFHDDPNRSRLTFELWLKFPALHSEDLSLGNADDDDDDESGRPRVAAPLPLKVTIIMMAFLFL
jgi:hypothetical protein